MGFSGLEDGGSAWLRQPQQLPRHPDLALGRSRPVPLPSLGRCPFAPARRHGAGPPPVPSQGQRLLWKAGHDPRSPGWLRRERTVLGAPWSAFQGLPGPAAVTSSHGNPGNATDWPCGLRAPGPWTRSPTAMLGGPVKPAPSQGGYTSLSPIPFPFGWRGAARMGGSPGPMGESSPRCQVPGGRLWLSPPSPAPHPLLPSCILGSGPWEGTEDRGWGRWRLRALGEAPCGAV